jgi:predicted nucleic acid-binding protein
LASYVKYIVALVVADTGPLHFLVLTGDIALLPRLFIKVLTPERVRDELAHERAPEPVLAWIAAPRQRARDSRNP